MHFELEQLLFILTRIKISVMWGFEFGLEVFGLGSVYCILDMYDCVHVRVLCDPLMFFS